jgi:hypothetical protein
MVRPAAAGSSPSFGWPRNQPLARRVVDRVWRLAGPAESDVVDQPLAW